MRGDEDLRRKTGDVEVFTTNDLPGCPKGGLLLGTDKADAQPDRPGLDGQDGDDKIRGLGGKDPIFGGPGNDVIYGGDDSDDLWGDEGKDVIYGGDGNDMLSAKEGQRDKLYCGEGKDRYLADNGPRAGANDYVDSSCETASASAQSGYQSGHDVVFTSSASSVPVPPSGGPAILLPAAALLLWSGIVTYEILRRR